MIITYYDSEVFPSILVAGDSDLGKKVSNWLGYIVISLYILIFFILLFIGLQIDNSVGGFVLGLTVSWFFAAAGLTPATWRLTWSKILPLKMAQVKLISKSVNESASHIRAIPRTVTNLFLTFELSDGSRWSFKVRPDIFNSVQENDEGVLTFKGQGSRNYFVSFKRQ